MFSICGIVMYNLFILINDKCECMCKLEQKRTGNTEDLYSGPSTVVITSRIWVFDMDNALDKIDTFIPQLIPLFREVYPDSAAPNLSRHVI